MAAYRIPDVIISMPEEMFVLYSDYPIELKNEAIEKVRERLFGYTMIRPGYYPIYLWRVTPIEDPAQGVLIGQARLPDLRYTTLKNRSHFRDIITTLLFLFVMGHLPDHWTSRNLKQEQARVWKALPSCGPVWWPEGVTFKDPSIKNVPISLQDLRVALVRCYHLFNQGHLLPQKLMDLACEVMPEDPGQLNMTQQMMRSWHDNYLKEGAHGVD